MKKQIYRTFLNVRKVSKETVAIGKVRRPSFALGIIQTHPDTIVGVWTVNNSFPCPLHSVSGQPAPEGPAGRRASLRSNLFPYFILRQQEKTPAHP
ncbi:MAG: hypothetical protein ACE5EE_11080 [Fidelibacterota bacterium]